MTDPDLLEAVAVIKGSASIKVSPYGVKMGPLLDKYSTREYIRYSPLKATSYGRSIAFLPVDTSITTFIDVNVAFKGDVASTAFVLAHEAVHRAIDDDGTLDGELKCRTWDVSFGAELKSGIVYKSLTGATVRVTLAGSPLEAEIDKTINNERSQTQVDRVLAISGGIYIKYLSPKWVLANLGNWGGLDNRSDNTLGLYLNSIGADPSGDWGTQLVDIIEQFTKPPRNWASAKAVIGDMSALRRGLRKVYDAPVAGRRIGNCEKVLHEKFN